MPLIRPILVVLLFAAGISTYAQQKITSMVTSNSSAPMVTYNNVKGSGLRGNGNTLASNWDSTGSNFTVNFNATANSITSITQFTVANHPRPMITWPLNAQIKIRRLANAYVTDTRNYFNFWTVYSSIPAVNLLTGTFNIAGPEVTTPELALLSNNINSGYDNIFQNTINNLHANNIERIDFILPSGLKPTQQLDIDGAGAVVFDRGTGDNFNIAAILSLDGSNNPLTYGPMISVTASSFGNDLKATPSTYCIFTHDPKYPNSCRPSTAQTQNIRGVFTSLGDLGIALNQRFYGYSIFGADVAAATPDWTTYPIATNSGNQLDPVNVFTLFKDVNSILPVPMTLSLTEENNKPTLQYTISNDIVNEQVAIERSENGRDFIEITRQTVDKAGRFYFTDQQPVNGTAYYRVQLIEKTGITGYSETKSIRLEEEKISVSPNPVTDNINLSLPSSWFNQEVSVVLYNTAAAKQYETSFVASTTLKRIPVKGIRPGNYLLRITNKKSGITQVKKILINH
jgi:hypothetical protein